MRAVVADDDQAFRELMVLALRRSGGLEVVGLASSGEEAVSLAKTLRPDVVVLDVQVPGSGGLWALRELRRCLPGVRVVMVSGADGGAAQEARLAGAARVLVKGVSPDVLAREVKEAAMA